MRSMLGVRNPRIASALAPYGFTHECRDEGWALLNALAKGVCATPVTEPRDMEALQNLDAWENRWLPITVGVLERRFPATAAKFFLQRRWPCS